MKLFLPMPLLFPHLSNPPTHTNLHTSYFNRSMARRSSQSPPSSSIYNHRLNPKIGGGVGQPSGYSVAAPPIRNSHANPSSSPSSSGGMRIRVSSKPEFRITPPVLVEKLGLPSGFDCGSSTGYGDLMGCSQAWATIEHRIATLEFDRDKKSMGVIVSSNSGKKSLLVKDIPIDKTGEFDTIYGFLRDNWNICKWVAFGAVILQALIFLLAVVVRAANEPAEYDSDDEYISGPWQRQPLISRQPVLATVVPCKSQLLVFNSYFKLHEK